MHQFLDVYRHLNTYCSILTPIRPISRVQHTGLTLVKYRITRYYPGRPRVQMYIEDTDLSQVDDLPIYLHADPVRCRFQLLVALIDHNPLTLQTDGRTDVMLVA